MKEKTAMRLRQEIELMEHRYSSFTVGKMVKLEQIYWNGRMFRSDILKYNKHITALHQIFKYITHTIVNL